MKYRYLLFDADNTLVQFSADQERAFRAAFLAAGVSVTDGAIADCGAFSYADWEELGLSDVHLPQVRDKFHSLYRVHIKNIFDYAAPKYGMTAQRVSAEAEFVHAFSQAAHPLNGADGVLRALSERYCLCAATNGLKEIQYGRLSAFKPYLSRVFVSEEVGAVKPERAFFTHILTELGAAAEECLMVGDSLISDIAGANAAGIDCVWYNPKRLPLPKGYRVKADVSSLSRLTELL